jgi:hypothetical protein
MSRIPTDSLGKLSPGCLNFAYSPAREIICIYPLHYGIGWGILMSVLALIPIEC